MFIQKTFISLTTLLLFIVFSTSKVVYSQDIDCDFTQITDTTDGETRDVSTNSNGTILVFVSDQDLTGSNADGNLEIYLFDVNTSMFTQVTNTTGGNNVSPTMSSDGLLVVFTSANDITGDNADANSEVFLLNTQTTTITQLTDTTGGGPSFSQRFPVINSAGTHIAFVSNRDHTGINADGNIEFFLLDIDTLIFTQITDTTAISHNNRPSINSDGSIIAFPSEANLAVNNVDLSQELFTYNAITDTIAQVTDSTGSTVSSNRSPSVSPDGLRIAFESDLNLTGNNPDGDIEIYLFDSAADSITQITNTDSVNRTSSFSSDGNIIILTSTANLTGENPDENIELFFYNIADDMFSQLTNSMGGFGFGSSFNSNLTFFAATHNTDITGVNSDLNTEVFIAECLAVIQSISNSGNGGCSLAPSGKSMSDLSLFMVFPALLLLRRLIRRKHNS